MRGVRVARMLVHGFMLVYRGDYKGKDWYFEASSLNQNKFLREFGNSPQRGFQNHVVGVVVVVVVVVGIAKQSRVSHRAAPQQDWSGGKPNKRLKVKRSMQTQAPCM